MGSVLPEGWKQVCTKGHTTEHSSKCTHWICPQVSRNNQCQFLQKYFQGRRYKEWSDVQAYFQLLHFEEDIPGVECRPENAKKIPLVEDVEDEVTLEEATKKEMEDKINKTKNMKELKRKRTTNDSSDSGGENDTEKKGKKN